MNNSNRSYSDAPLLESLEPRLLLSGSVVISEFMASNNTTTTDGAGNSPDWFELYNPTDTAVDLTGWHLTDNANDLTQWAFPSGGSIDLTLNPGERMLVFASGQDDLDYPYDDGTYYHTNFKLSTNDSGQNEDAMLSDSAGVLVHGYENYARQFTDVSYGIHLSSAWWDTLVGEGDPVAYHVPTAGDASDMPDPGVSEGWTAADFDDSTWTDSMLFGAAGVVISEINTGVPNFVEIQNVSAAAVDSTNWTVLLNDAVGGDINSVDADVWALPSSLAPGEVMYRTDDPGDNYWGGNILWDIDQPGWAMVIDDLGEIVDFAVWGYTEAQIASLDISYGGFSNITVGEQWRGDGVDLVGGGDPKPPQDAIAFGSVWNYMHPLDGQDPALSDADFNSTWMMSAGYDGPVFDNSGQAILGFGSIDYGTVRTNIGTPPSGSRYTGYFRSDFVLDDPMIEVGIEILSDDGAFIYIDGVEVGRNNISPTATDTYTVFAINHTYPDGTNVETQTRTLSIADLDAGTHTIAVSVHQANTGSSDMGLDLRLFGRPLIGGELMRRSGQSDGDTESDFDPNDESTKGVQNPDVILPFGVVLDTTTGIGFSDNQSEFEDVIQTDVSDEMQGVNDSIWTRMEFVASDDLSAFGSLTLGMMYDDGFVAYLNGVQIAQRNAPLALAWDSSATSVHGNSQAVVYEDIDVGMNLLLEGANVLTIHGLNAAADPADFLIRPKLVATGDASVPRHFAVATPNQTNTDQWWQYVEDTEFDHDRGFYIDPFDLVITSDTADAQIYYTTNGASPLMSNGGIDGDATLYAAPIPISTTTVVRAVAIKTDHAPTNVDSHTYIFLDDVINQPDYPTGFPTSWGSHPSEYGMDPDVVNNPLYSGTIKDDLKSIPTMSLVMDIDDIFGAGGIYSNTGGSGVGWERPVSVEMINGDSTTMFQENAGVRIYGGVGRNSSFEKHTLRLLFKSDYGDTKLRYPLFGEDATDEFDTIILRAGFNNTWHRHSGGEENRAQYIRDEWIRQTQLDMDQIGLAGTFVHLYINGLYWGLYNPVERANADFASSYLGGVKEDYDALNSYPRKVVDGTADAWIETQNRSDEIPVDYDRVAEYVDIPNLIDYMLVNFYGGNQDWDDHNWYSVRKREDLAEWKFISWDSERILESITGSNRTGINQHNKPSNIYAGLRSLLEFQVEFADRAHMHLFNGGVLTPAATTARYQELATFIDRAIVGESARWGDSSRTSDPYTRDDEWVAERDRLLYQYFPQRTNVLLGFLRGAGLYPNLDAPVFRIGGSYQHGGEISHAALLSMSSGAGTIYYTTDGTDPRASGGAVNGTQYSGGNITLTQPTRVRARRYDNGEWSALNDATYYINPPTAGELTVTEINYNPHAPTNDELATQQVGDLPFKSSDFEFIELYNTTGHTIDLLDVEFSRGVEVTISSGQQTTLPTGQYALIVANLSAFEARYGTGLNVMGVFTGSLDNSGEMLTFGHPVEATLQELVYNDAGAWPNRADGGGSSLELIDLQGDYADGSNWRSSSEYGGSPGFAGSGPRSDVVVNEIITHSDEPLTDVIELHNTTGSPIDIGGWFLSDGGGDYAKFEIPPGTIIPDGGYAVFYEGHYFEGAFEVDYATEFGGPGEKDFALSGSHGDDVWLLEADVSGKLLSFVDHVEFIGAVNGESFGRWNNGVGDLYPMTSLTLGAANSFPRVGPVIISEVMYNAPDPDGPGGVDPGDLEFIELYNPTSEAIPLAAFANSPHGGPQYFADWRLRGGVDMEFDPGTTIGAQSMLVILSFDPNAPVNAARVADFRLHYGIDASVPLTGGYRGVLDNGGDRITLQRPDSPTAVEPDFVPHVFEDQVRYDDLAPWATSPDGLGDSLQRTPINGWGDDPANWIAGTPDPGAYASINNSPVVDNPIADVTVDEDAVDTVVDLSATFSDPDLNTFTLSVTGNTDAGLVAVSMNVDQLTLSYLADQNGSTDITIRATDTLGAWTEDTFTVTVNPTPDPPTLNNPVADFSVDEDASDTVIDLSSVFDDPDLPGDTLAYSITSNTNISLVTTNIVGSDLTLSYAADQNGSSEITVRATDQNGAGSWVEDTFTVTVDPVNDAPTLASPLAEVTVDEDAPDTVIDLSSVFDDIDLGDALTFQVTVNTNISLVATDVTGSDLTLSYLADQSGSADITVRATDSGAPGLFVEDTFTVTVDPVNDAPTVIAPISDVNVFENDPGEILNLAGVFYDAEDGANVTLSLEGNTNPALVTANLVGSDLTVSYAADQSGSSDITIRATDTAAPGLWVEETFTVTVNPDNFAPTVVSQIADLTVNTGDPDTVMYLSDVFDDSVGLKPTLDYTVIEIDPVTGAQTAGSGLFLYTFTLYGNDGVESVFATTTLTFTGAIQQTKAFGTADVNDELNAAIFEGIAGSGYIAGLDTWIFAGWQEIAPDDTSLTGAPVVLSVGSGTAEYFEQKDLVQIVAAGDVQWTGMHSRLGADYPTSGAADANRLVYSISDNTNPGLVTASVVGAQLTLDYSPGGSGLADITIRATDPDGAWVEDTFTVTVESSGEIVGRHVFYNNSAWDGVSDDDAIASDKTALLAGQTASFANYTSYSRGINGIMVDIAGMTGTPDASDFGVRVNEAANPDTWSAGPAPTVTVRPGEGVGGSDRVTLAWPDGAIANQWVEVTVLATADTGLAAADVFYFGNAAGETSGDGVIGQAEYDTFKSQFGQRGGIGALASDFDGDGRVGLRDFTLMRSRFGDEVQSPTVPAPAPVAAAAPAPALAPEADLLAESSTTSEAAALDPLSVAVGEVDLSTPTASPAPEPSVELELTDVLLGEDSGEGTDASLDTDSLLVDVLAESTMTATL